jgi:hypothetical protein
MMYSEIIAVCSQIHTKHINTLFGHYVEFVNVKRGGTYSNHWALEATKPNTSQTVRKTQMSCALMFVSVTALCALLSPVSLPRNYRLFVFVQAHKKL